MTYNKAQVESILKTLPIGYYIKRGVSVTLDETSDCSYYNPVNDAIVISYKQLSNALDSCPGTEFVESDVRTILYHEVSHAFLTPKNMKVNKVMNIFEDERIESLLRNYYKGVKFREFVKRINKFEGQKPTSADDAFYQLVRYRIGEDYWLKRLHDLIVKYNSLTRETDYTYSYKLDVDEFYNDFVKDWSDKEPEESPEGNTEGEEPKDNTSESNNSGSDTSDDSETSDEETDETETYDDKPSKGKSGDEKETEELSKPSSSDEESDNESDDEVEVEDTEEDFDEAFNAEVAKEIFSNCGINVSTELQRKVTEALSKIKNVTKQNGSAINAYSGVFNPRSVARDDYRYFVQKNRLGNMKAFSKTKLNLFIDVSGSFYYNQNKTNELLRALSDFEKTNPDFSYDIVTMAMGEKLLTRNERLINCNGGNKLDNKIFELFNKLQDRNCNTYNIVLFDGDALSDAPRDYEKNFQAFNHSNTHIISDPDNKGYISRNCKSAKVTITKDYVNELEDNIIKILNQMSR